MIGNAGVSDSAQEDSVKRPQLLNAVRRHHASGLDIGFATPIERVPLELESKALSGGFQNPDALRNHFFPNTISGNHCYVESLHGRSFILSRLPTTVPAHPHPEPSLGS